MDRISEEMDLSFTNKIVLLAYQKGYRVQENGDVVGPRGRLLSVKVYGKQKYPTISINLANPDGSRSVYGIPTHRLAGFCFFGYQIFQECLKVRHLDGNVLNLARTNIDLGTNSMNEHDKPVEVRRKVGRIARSHQPARGYEARFTEDQVVFIRDFCSNGKGFHELGRRFDVTPQAIYRIVKRLSYADVA